VTELLTVAWVSILPMDIIRATGQRHDVDPFLIAAICMQESAGRIYAQRFEPNYRWFYNEDAVARLLGCSLGTEVAGQQTSYGLMQIMGAVLRELGFNDWFGKAFAPHTNIEFGTRHLAKFLERYGSTEKAIASYNAGSPRYKAGSRVFENQKYVDGVMKFWKEAAGGKSIA